MGFLRGGQMPSSKAKQLTVKVGDQEPVSALLLAPAGARAALVFAHGAGAGMTHPFLAEISTALADRGIATLRYQFPFMEKKSKRPDPPKLAQATVRAAVAEARRLLPALPLFAGGKSFGGRMTSQAQAEAPLAGIQGLVFFGFPLHAAGKPSRDRAAHLSDIKLPMLFLQGTRDNLAALSEIEPVCAGLGKRATLKLFEDADHSFHVPARSGRTDAEVRSALLDAIEAWIEKLTPKH
jgi:predicted alpha/beta-hydrolase family hydrolase